MSQALILNGTYTIASAAFPNLVVDLSGDNHRSVILYTANGGANQVWLLNDPYQVALAEVQSIADPEKFWSVSSDGTNVVPDTQLHTGEYIIADYDLKLWSIEASPTDEKYVYITLNNTGLVVTAPASSVAGTQLTLASLEDTPDLKQQWWLQEAHPADN